MKASNPLQTFQGFIILRHMDQGQGFESITLMVVIITIDLVFKHIGEIHILRGWLEDCYLKRSISCIEKVCWQNALDLGTIITSLLINPNPSESSKECSPTLSFTTIFKVVLSRDISAGEGLLKTWSKTLPTNEELPAYSIDFSWRMSLSHIGDCCWDVLAFWTILLVHSGIRFIF